MPIQFQGYTESLGTEIHGYSPAYPANAAGQVLLAFINVARGDDLLVPPVVTPPAGWTLVIDNAGGGAVVLQAVYKKLGDGSTGTMTWTFDCSVRGNIDILCYSGIDQTTPVDASAFRNESSLSTSHLTNTVTPSLPNSLIIGFWADVNTGTLYSGPSDMSERVNLDAPHGGNARATLIADVLLAVAATVSKTATTNQAVIARSIILALKPEPNPTIPVLTAPNGGEQITVGASFAVTWQAATSPTAAQSSLKYHIQYSANGGITWTDIVALTSAGVTTYSWNTTGLTAGNNYLVRIRSYDPALAIYSDDYDVSNAVFSLVAETAPAAPTGLSPSGGAVQDKASPVTMSWIHSGGAGNPQTEFTLQWSRDNFASHTATVGPTVTSTSSTSIDFSGEAVGATISWRVKTKGVSLYSAYSAIAAFVVAVKPSTPTNLLPSSSVPPSVPLPTISYTLGGASTDQQVTRKMRVTENGIEIYNSGWVASTATSFASPFSFANGHTYSLFISIQNSYGLASAEGSQTFTVNYTGPATPRVTLTAIDGQGGIQATIANTDIPAYNQLWRYLLGQTKADAILIGDQIAVNGTFIDYNVVSGVSYIYFARAYNSTGLFSDSTTG